MTTQQTTRMVDEEERQRWIHQGHASFAEFMGRVEKIDRLGVRGINASEKEKRVTLIDKRKIYATLEEIADLYVNDEKKLVLDFTESKPVAVLASPSPAKPMEYIGLRWSYYRSPSRLVPSQDFFYLETMKPFVDILGRRGWAKCSHSVQHSICPDLSAMRGVNRGQLYYSGVVFIESHERGVLDTTFYYTIDTSAIPTFLLPILLKARGKGNAELINHYVKLARVTAYAGRSDASKLAQQLVDEKRCGACSNRLPKWLGKAKCHFCQSYVCKRCTEIIEKNFLFDDGTDKLCTCMQCAEAHGTKITSLIDDENSSCSSGRESGNADLIEQRYSTHTTPHSTPVLGSGRCMSMPILSRPASASSMELPHLQPATARPPAKLLDLGLEGLSLTASCPRRTAKEEHQPSEESSHAPHVHVHRRHHHALHHHYPGPASRRAGHRNIFGNGGGVTVTLPPRRMHGPPPPMRRHIERMPHAPISCSDELASAGSPVTTAKPSAAPCDLSYLNAFKT